MKYLSLSFVGLFGLLLTFSASPVLAQGAAEQVIVFAGTVRRVVVDFETWPPNPIYLEEPGLPVTITFIAADNRRVLATATSGPDGSFTTAMVVPPEGRWVYTIATGSGFRPTASFLFHVPGDVIGLVVPIVEDKVFDFLVRLSEGVHQHTPKRSMILAFFHPTGQWPIHLTPHHLGVAPDARETFAPFPTVVPEVPPGDRRWLGFRGPRPAPTIVADFKTPGFTPFALVIYNAHRWRHPVDHRVRAYRVGRLDAWPAEGYVVVCPGGVAARAAPTPVDITVGVVRCRPIEFKLPGGKPPS